MNVSLQTLYTIKQRILQSLYHNDIILSDRQDELIECLTHINEDATYEALCELKDCYDYKKSLLKREKRINKRIATFNNDFYLHIQ